jgi:murein DD-endopeptidase MepM/ murein hydrolase activator NlpD
MFGGISVKWIGLLVLLVGVMVGLVGCSGNKVNDEITTKFTVGTEGGSFTSIDGLIKIDIPPNNLTQTTTITVTTSKVELPSNVGKVIGNSYDFSPNNLTFDMPVTLTAVYNSNHQLEVTNSQEPVLAIESRGTWMTLDASKFDSSKGEISAETTHFGKVAIVLPALTTNPTPDAILDEITNSCTQSLKIPEIIVAVVVTKESNWKQFDDIKNEPLIGTNGFDIGIMQLNPVKKAIPFDTERSKLDWKYNLEIGCQILSSKFKKYAQDSASDYDTFNDTDPSIIENWFYPLAWYNGEGDAAFIYISKVWEYISNLPSPAGEVLPNSSIPSLGNPRRLSGFPDTIHPQIPYPKGSVDLDNATPNELIAHGMFTLLLLAQNGQKIHRWGDSLTPVDITKEILDDPSPIPVPTARIPFLWPLSTFKDVTSILSQDYAERRDASENHHSGIDIRGEKGTDVLSVAPGWIDSIQELNANQDYGFGNSVTVGHKLENDMIVYSHYAHLDTITSDILRACGGQEGVPGERLKCPSPDFTNSIIVTGGQKLGTLGGSGKGKLEFWNPHLHFAIKSFSTLGTQGDDDGEFGYTEDLPNNSGHYDPIDFLHLVINIEPPKLVKVTSIGSGYSIRMGPGGYDNGTQLGIYRAIDTVSSGKSYTATAYSENGFLGCAKGWYQIANVGGAYFEDVHELDPGAFGRGEIIDGWVCQDAFNETTLTISGKIDNRSAGNLRTTILYPTLLANPTTFFQLGTSASVDADGNFSLDISNITPPTLDSRVQLVPINPPDGVTVDPTYVTGAEFSLIVFNDFDSDETLDAGETFYLLDDRDNTFVNRRPLSLQYAEKDYTMTGESETTTGNPVNWNVAASEGWGRFIFQDGAEVKVSYSDVLSDLQLELGSRFTPQDLASLRHEANEFVVFKP